MFNNAFSSHLTDSVQRMLNKKLAKELGVESGTIMDATYPVALTKYNIGMGVVTKQISLLLTLTC